MSMGLSGLGSMCFICNSSSCHHLLGNHLYQRQHMQMAPLRPISMEEFVQRYPQAGISEMRDFEKYLRDQEGIPQQPKVKKSFNRKLLLLT